MTVMNREHVFSRPDRRLAGLSISIQFLMPAQGDWIRLVWPALL